MRIGDKVKYPRGHCEYELVNVSSSGFRCTIRLPDGREYRAKIEDLLLVLTKKEVSQNNRQKEAKQQEGIKMSDLKKTINKLNGLKLGEENLVELSQEVSTVEKVKISLYSVLKENSNIKKLGLGEEALITDIGVNCGVINLTVSCGDVEKESNMALLNSISNLVSSSNTGDSDL